MTKKVCLLLADGFEDIEAIGTFAILRRCGVSVDLYALSGKNATGKFGLFCTALNDFANLNAKDYDGLVLPGGPAYVLLEKNEKVQHLIQQYIQENKIVAAICASPTILGKKGYLKGKNYTCFTAMNEDFGGHFIDAYAVTDGNIVTGQSAAAAIDFGFAIAEKLVGKETVEKTKKAVYYK